MTDDRQPSIRIPLAEESLDVTVHRRQEGVVRFVKRVETDAVDATVDVQSDDVFIERVRHDREIAEAREPWYEGDTLVIPVYEERLVVEKRVVLVEEIRIHRAMKTEAVTVRDTVRREVVDIETEATPEG